MVGYDIGQFLPFLFLFFSPFFPGTDGSYNYQGNFYGKSCERYKKNQKYAPISVGGHLPFLPLLLLSAGAYGGKVCHSFLVMIRPASSTPNKKFTTSKMVPSFSFPSSPPPPSNHPMCGETSIRDFKYYSVAASSNNLSSAARYDAQTAKKK